MSAWMDAEHDLDRLLARLDRVIEDEEPDLAWEVWWSLPWGVRDLLLRSGPAWWWNLSRPRLHRLLLVTARLIVWQGVAPLTALRRAGVGLRLPPPRMVSAPRARRPVGAGRARAAARVSEPPVRRSTPRPPAARVRPALRPRPMTRVRRRAPMRFGGGRLRVR